MSPETGFFTSYPEPADDWRVDVYSNMAGNTVRVTHIPTGVVGTCGDYKSQLQNRHAAFTRALQRLAGGTA